MSPEIPKCSPRDSITLDFWFYKLQYVFFFYLKLHGCIVCVHTAKCFPTKPIF